MNVQIVTGVDLTTERQVLVPAIYIYLQHAIKVRVSKCRID